MPSLVYYRDVMKHTYSSAPTPDASTTALIDQINSNTNAIITGNANSGASLTQNLLKLEGLILGLFPNHTWVNHH